MRTLLATLALLLTLPAVAIAQTRPDPTTSEYFRTTAAGIAIDPNSNPPRLFYGMTLLVEKPLPEGSVMTVEFENPQAGAEPLPLLIVPTGRDNPGDDLPFISPDLSCITNNRNYRVSVQLVVGRRVVSTHEQIVNFSVPAQELQRLNVAQCRDR